ncbi:MAG: hypothetical protein GY703_16900 [Gammaproteobacteria bacterium]|nr:hypothetical protein [Gammaproteobacteria bacterium]
MPEISQPTPVKPIWPTRRDSPGKSRKENGKDEEQEPRQGDIEPQIVEKSKVDDYA